MVIIKMSDVYPWIGFKRKEDRERFKQRIFSEQKKKKPSVSEDVGSISFSHQSSRLMTDKEIRDVLNIHNVHYGELKTFYIISDVAEIPKNYYWMCFRGYWDLLEKLEKAIKKEYKDYIYLVAH
jgi:hypothetical protein